MPGGCGSGPRRGADWPPGPISSFSPFSGGSPAAPSVQGSPLGYAGQLCGGRSHRFYNDRPRLQARPGVFSGTGSPLDLSPAAGGGASAAAPSAGSAATSAIPSGLKNLGTLLALGVGGQVASPAITRALGLDKVPGSANLTNLANESSALASQQQAYGNTLEQPLITGQLPAGQQQTVTNALNDATATIKARYAALGLSGSSMEAEAVANAQNQSTSLAAQIAAQDAQTGASAVSSATQNLGLEDQIYQSIMQATIGQDQQLGNAISKFASAAGTGVALKGLNTST